MVPTPQVCVSTLVTVSTMAVVDLYLLEQSMLGARGPRAECVAVCRGVARRSGIPARTALRVGRRDVGGEVATPRLCQRALVPLPVAAAAQALLRLP
ncbi:Transmembrane protein 121 [Dissostichus eleginoides]|uniref:Transmembrane protein 121 n=1 Tax=Dissostichus eleginoides TaxID=100907 RepID=A0AAD9CN44_DISEL|nr:Transmembrane protein 121 [Dissostichus eleginoides]